MFRNTFIAICCVRACLLPAQAPQLSAPEFLWAATHPFAAFKVKKISRQCDRLFVAGDINRQIDAYSSGGQLDAYRHVFYMAAFARKIAVAKLRKLGRAHEKANYRQFRKNQTEEGERPDSLASEMDLRNNELGFAIGCNFRHLGLDELSAKVLQDIRQGKAVIMKRDGQGRYLDCENRVIPLNEYRGRWTVPKCLVGSDYQSSS